MRQNKKDTVKGVLPKLLRWSGVEPTERNLFRARATIVLVGCVVMVYFYVTGDDAGDSYGNYNEFKARLR